MGFTSEGVANVLQYSSTLRYNSVAPFALLRWWDTELTWHSLSDTHLVYLYDLEHDLGFRPA